jgi:hypothetical protein
VKGVRIGRLYREGHGNGSSRERERVRMEGGVVRMGGVCGGERRDEIVGERPPVRGRGGRHLSHTQKPWEAGTTSLLDWVCPLRPIPRQSAGSPPYKWKYPDRPRPSRLSSQMSSSADLPLHQYASILRCPPSPDHRPAIPHKRNKFSRLPIMLSNHLPPFPSSLPQSSPLQTFLSP